MRFSLIVPLYASLISALSIQPRIALPACAAVASCTANLDYFQLGCSAYDTACLCQNPTYMWAANGCILLCSVPDAQAGIQALSADCTAHGVNFVNPVPTCAVPCFKMIVPTTCPVTDVPCMCNDPNWIQPIATCVRNSCTSQDIVTAQSFIMTTCSTYVVDTTSIII